MEVKAAPPFVAVNGAKADHDAQTVDVLFLARDGEHYAVKVHAHAIPAAIASLTAIRGELASSLDEGDVLPNQALTPSEFHIAMNPDGQIAWKIVAQDGIEFVLRIEPDQFALLESKIAEVRALLDRKVQ